MTLDDLRRLPPAEQYYIVLEQGTFLRARTGPLQAMILYALGNFFVELIYDVEDLKFISLTAFRSMRRVEPYLEPIQK